MRVVPGARPPQWQWKITKKSRVRVLEQVGDGGGEEGFLSACRVDGCIETEAGGGFEKRVG